MRVGTKWASKIEQAQESHVKQGKNSRTTELLEERQEIRELHGWDVVTVRQTHRAQGARQHCPSGGPQRPEVRF